ncbi:MAG: DUF192 domain-containing protein [Saprospiraceae bacterium]
MAKQASKKTTAGGKNRSAKPLPTRRWAVWAVPIIIILFVVGFVFSSMPNFKQTKVQGPQFRKEGTLQFLSAASGQTLAAIDIEIADDDMTRTQGLMWRRSLADNHGMLFIMDMQEEQAFWMRNTYIPLDIIYVNDQFEIVRIRANTQPQTLNQVTSNAPALYVVEVNAGFTEQHGIKEGDKIAFQRLQ